MRRKYKPGGYIISLDDLMKQEFVYCAGKLVHKDGLVAGNCDMQIANLPDCVSEKPKKSKTTHEHRQAV